jgi:hypothetical protein
MRPTSRGDVSGSVFAEQPWAGIPELELDPPLNAASTQRYFFGERRSRNRKSFTDPQGRVVSDVTRSIQQGCYYRLAGEAPPTSFEGLYALARRSAVTIVTLRQPTDNDLTVEDVRSEWGLTEHWTVAQSLVLADVEGGSREVQVEFLGPPGTAPGSTIGWADGALYAYPWHLLDAPDGRGVGS